MESSNLFFIFFGYMLPSTCFLFGKVNLAEVTRAVSSTFCLLYSNGTYLLQTTYIIYVNLFLTYKFVRLCIILFSGTVPFVL